jgi:hypothetical protein
MLAQIHLGTIVVGLVAALAPVTDGTQMPAAQPDSGTAAWDRAEDARMACCPGMTTCKAPLPRLDQCEIKRAPIAFDSYREAFDGSQATNLDALRRCEELADSIIEQRSGALGRSLCAHSAEGQAACQAKLLPSGCARRNVQQASLWWAPLEQGANLADAGNYAEARRRFGQAYQLYLNSTGPAGRFLEAWYILRESIRGAFSACGASCSPQTLQLGEVLGDLRRLFERFNQTCHGSAVDEVKRVCVERNLLRAERAVMLVQESLHREAADLLEAAYSDCVRLIRDEDAEHSSAVLACWRTYGRRSVWLRDSDAAGTGRAADAHQVQRARTLASNFMRDVDRECSSGTQLREIDDICKYLAAPSKPNVTGEPRRKDETETAAVFPVPAADLRLARHGDLTDPEHLLRSPLYDALLNPASIPPQQARDALLELARGVTTQQSQAQTARHDCTRIDSFASGRACAASRLLHSAQGAVKKAALSGGIVTPQPSGQGTVSSSRSSDSSQRECVGCRRGGWVMLGIGAGGAIVAGIGAILGTAAENENNRGEGGDPEDAGEERQEATFLYGEAANRAAVGGAIIAGAGVLIGTALLVTDAVGRRSRRVRAGLGGVRVSF